MESKRPIVFIGAPVYGAVGPEVLEDWMRFAYHLGRRMPAYDFLLGIKAKSEQFRARNTMIDGALQAGADWILMLDDDMIINPFVTSGPTDDYGFLDTLIAHDKDVCGVLYYQRNGACQPVLMTAVGPDAYRFLRDDEVEHRLQRVDVAGGGCLLIKARVFDKVMPPYFEPEFKFGTDVQICRKALEKGFEVWADTSIEFGHLRDERVTITSRNRQGFMFSDTIAGETKQQFVASGIYQSLIEDAQEFTGYEDVIEMNRVSAEFLTHRHETLLTDAEWYRLYPKERVARQVMFNTANAYKRQMTEFILASIGPPPLDVLDFGCGIGLIGFTLAQHGYRVTALDIGGSGPLEFLKWRAKKHGVQMTFHESLGGVPGLCGTHYNAIVAMDSLEHLKDWRRALRELADHLKPQGGLFSNNAILVDDLHPEHYPLGNREFVAACVSLGLMPVNQITYVKKPEAAPVHGGLVADPAQELVDA